MTPIRLATVSDAEELAALASRTFFDTYAAQNTADDMRAHISRSYEAAIQRAEIQDESMRTLLAVDGADRAIGYAQLRLRDPRHAEPACVINPPPPAEPMPNPMEIWRFYVDKPWHGRGVAQRLMNATLALARSLGARSVWLGVWEKNPRGIAFYRKCGFEHIGEHDFIFADQPQTDLVMARAVCLDGP